jgi:ankyrin repeat protein
MAAVDGDVDSIKDIVRMGGDINTTRKGDGKTPLAIAAEKGSLEAVKMLVVYKADVNIPDINGNIPVHHAGNKVYLIAV